ncbi:hypothetical protein GGQ84_000075 [Desulfitispora alkaliphila]|uniref:7TM-DISM domain-containing protein n=1 Tax=Desulfitispora alkaliphila TaxID=622674 RepID=UPI003D238295
MRKYIAKITIITVICISILIIDCAFSPLDASEQPEAVNGLLDLRDWDWEQDGIITLDGKWEFYWQELLTPKDFPIRDLSVNKSFIPVPRTWNNYAVNAEALSGEGYATYRLLVHTSDEQIIGLKIPRIFTSYNLWANGKLIASNGEVGKDSDHSTPQYLPKVKYIHPEADTVELIVQVANFYHRSGGILESLSMGSGEQINQLRSRNLANELFLFGSLFIIGAYHLCLFIFRSKDRSFLYFGIYTILIALRTVLVGEIYFINLFPNFSWELAHKIQTLAYYMGIPLIFMFLKSIYPKDISKRFLVFVQAVGLSFSLLVLLTPAKFFTQFNSIYQIFTLLTIPYFIYFIFSICRCHIRWHGARSKTTGGIFTTGYR